MKRLFSTLLVFLVNTFCVFAQNSPQDLFSKQIKLQKASTWTLAGWSVANLAVSGIGIGSAQGSTKYFHEMNLYWNAVNAGIAGLGLVHLYKKRDAPTLSSIVREHYGLQNSLLLNSGLDVAYVTSGLWLMDKSKTESDPKRHDRFRGFGQAIVVQGGFLLLFDVTNLLIHRSQNPKLHHLLDKVAFNSTGVVIKF